MAENSNRLRSEIAFYTVEMELWRGDMPYIVLAAKEAAFKLDMAGGIGPYVYECQPADGRVSPHILIASEQ